MVLEKVKEIIDKNTQIENSENLSEDDDEEEKLPQPDPPFLKPKRSDDPREYTLVLDLDETLVHSIAETGKSLCQSSNGNWELHNDFI